MCWCSVDNLLNGCSFLLCAAGEKRGRFRNFGFRISVSPLHFLVSVSPFCCKVYKYYRRRRVCSAETLFLKNVNASRSNGRSSSTNDLPSPRGVACSGSNQKDRSTSSLLLKDNPKWYLVWVAAVTCDAARLPNKRTQSMRIGH
jgi:hypothetical protein